MDVRNSPKNWVGISLDDNERISVGDLLYELLRVADFHHLGAHWFTFVEDERLRLKGEASEPADGQLYFDYVESRRLKVAFSRRGKHPSRRRETPPYICSNEFDGMYGAGSLARAVARAVRVSQ